MHTLRHGLRNTFSRLRTTHPRLIWTLSALVWLPTAVAFTESFYTVMVVSGRSMQVRQVAVSLYEVLTVEAASPR